MEVGYRVGCVLATLSFPLFLLLWPRCHHSMRSALERESVGDFTADCCSDCATALELILQSWSSNSHSGSLCSCENYQVIKMSLFLGQSSITKALSSVRFPWQFIWSSEAFHKRWLVVRMVVAVAQLPSPASSLAVTAVVEWLGHETLRGMDHWSPPQLQEDSHAFSNIHPCWPPTFWFHIQQIHIQDFKALCFETINENAITKFTGMIKCHFIHFSTVH